MISMHLPPNSKRTVNPKSVFLLYLMCKNHISGKYDALKYNWRMTISDDAFNRRRDKYFFKRLSERYNLEELTHIFICNLVSNEASWVGDISSSDALSFYREHIGRFQRMEEVYKDDIKNIFYMQQKLGLKLGDIFEYNDKNVSVIFKLMQSKLITDETFIILDSFLGFINKHDQHNNNIVWSEYSVKVNSYKKLLIVDSAKAKLVFVNTLKFLKEINENVRT